MINSYKQLTINKYNELRKVLASDDMGLLDIQASVIAVLTDSTLDEILNLPLDKYQKCVEDTAFLLEKPAVDGKIPDRLTITTRDGNKMECVVVKDVDKLTASQYIDYQTLAAKPDDEQNIAAIMACFIIPKGKKYCDGYDIADVIDWLGKHMSIWDALNISFFFRKKYLRSIKTTLLYLEAKLLTMKWTAKTEKEKLTKAISEVRALYQSIQDAGDGLIW